jgi:hypothetical protein
MYQSAVSDHPSAHRTLRLGVNSEHAPVSLATCQNQYRDDVHAQHGADGRPTLRSWSTHPAGRKQGVDRAWTGLSAVNGFLYAVMPPPAAALRHGSGGGRASRKAHTDEREVAPAGTGRWTGDEQGLYRALGREAFLVQRSRALPHSPPLRANPWREIRASYEPAGSSGGSLSARSLNRERTGDGQGI